MKKIKMKKTSRFDPKAYFLANNCDVSHKGFAVSHDERTVYVFERTDALIRKGNDEYLYRYVELFNKYPSYRFCVHRFIFE